MEQKTPQTKAQKREDIMREETPKKANMNEEKHQKKQKLMSKKPSKKNVNKAKTNTIANKYKRVLRDKTQRESKGCI